MEYEKKNESPPIRTRMTCLIWIAILFFIVVFARVCSFLISAVGVR